jgi:hypothetical protein
MLLVLREISGGREGLILSAMAQRIGGFAVALIMASVLLASGSGAGAGVASVRPPGQGGRAAVICRPDGRRTVHSRGVGYIVRNDVFAPERECIRIHPGAVGFTVTKSHATSHAGNNDAFPEVIYGCEWGVCSWHTALPRKVYRLRVLDTSWATNWRRAPGMFDVAYDIWFGHLHEIHGQVRGAEMMIWLGTKRFSVPPHDLVLHIDGQRWYYARHLACDQFGCWNYVLFRRVVPVTRERSMSLLPFIHFAETRRQISYRWFLKSVDAGFEIWRRGTGLEVRSYRVRLRLRTVKHR